ncbi:hypothetical protein AGLY_011774 [Aphis glycines]|uniref:Uncharacterized protein n=1 Tax=Aphis glycines TaxID=307491 RepID=A0A6G0TC33_APHGL|nr:hypothetical protein AGLY_011774 [Aphis glycines]
MVSVIHVYHKLDGLIIQYAILQKGDELRRGRSSRRDDPRRHTLSGDQHHNYQPALTRSMDLESPASRGGYPPATGMLFDDDPGIMSEVETSSTGFRRGNKQRSSLPVVRTPSKTLERPLVYRILFPNIRYIIKLNGIPVSIIGQRFNRIPGKAHPPILHILLYCYKIYFNLKTVSYAQLLFNLYAFDLLVINYMNKFSDDSMLLN